MVHISYLKNKIRKICQGILVVKDVELRHSNEIWFFLVNLSISSCNCFANSINKTKCIILKVTDQHSRSIKLTSIVELINAPTFSCYFHVGALVAKKEITTSGLPRSSYISDFLFLFRIWKLFLSPQIRTIDVSKSCIYFCIYQFVFAIWIAKYIFQKSSQAWINKIVGKKRQTLRNSFCISLMIAKLNSKWLSLAHQINSFCLWKVSTEIFIWSHSFMNFVSLFSLLSKSDDTLQNSCAPKLIVKVPKVFVDKQNTPDVNHEDWWTQMCSVLLSLEQ